MSLSDFLVEIRNSVIEKLAIVCHNQNGLCGFSIVAEGTAEGVCFNPKDIIEAAQKYGGSSITLVHNHPTGPVVPSLKDLKATFAVQDLLKEVNLQLHDHIILGREGEPFSCLKNRVI